VRLIAVECPKRTQGCSQLLDAVKDKQGIIQFDIKFSDATGHFDLWNGTNMVEEHHSDEATTTRYFSMATGVRMWLAKPDAQS
jgi:hypothetical protein